MESPWEKKLSAMDGLIRGGQSARVRAELEKIRKGKIPRPLILNFAYLARRADSPWLAVRLLNPVVRPSRKAPSTASAAEKAEYAVGLIKIGATEEALEILGKLSAKTNPETLLYKAFALMTHWDYGATLPLLEQYCGLAQLDDYQRLVGKTNLAAALICERKYEPAEKILTALLADTKGGGHELLYGNALELSAQNTLLRGDWKRAEAFLGMARTALAGAGGREEFFVRKWEAIRLVLQEGGAEKSRAALDLVRKEATATGHWETLRQCDYFEALAQRDGAHMLRVYYGTPFPDFRKRIRKEWPEFQIPDSYVWQLGDGVAKETLNLLDGKISPKGVKLKPGQLLHRFLVVLATDAYRPFRVATLHHHLYPGEFFNPFTSPARVTTALMALRAWLTKHRLPLEVSVEDGLYGLKSRRAFSLLLHDNVKVGKKELPLLATLREHFEDRSFSVRDAGKVLNFPTRSALRTLQQAHADQALLREGKAAATRYRFPKK